MRYLISLLLLAPLFVNAEDFQSEFRFFADTFEANGGQNLREQAFIFGNQRAKFEEEGDSYSVRAIYFLETLETKKEPFRETAFVNRASYVQLELQDTENEFTRLFKDEPTVKTSSDSNQFGLSGRYLFNDKKWLIDGGFERISTDQSINGQNSEVTETRLKAGFGKYYEKNELAILSFEAIERTRSSSRASEYREETYILSGFGRHIIGIGTGSRLALEAEAKLGHDEYEAYRGFVLGGSLNGRWYFNQKLSVLAGIEVSKFYGDNEYASEERHEVFNASRFELSYFLNPTIEIFATFEREMTRSTYDGSAALIDREKLIGGGYGLGATARF